MASLITIPIGALGYIGMSRDYVNKSTTYMRSQNEMNSTLVEYVNGIEVIKAFSRSKSSYAKYESAVTDNAAFFYNWMKSAQWAMSAYNAITPSVLLTVLPFGFLFSETLILSKPSPQTPPALLMLTKA